MTTKAVAANGLSKQDAKHLALMDDYLRQIKQVRADMERSQAEINRLKAKSRRKLAEITTILNRVKATS